MRHLRDVAERVIPQRLLDPIVRARTQLRRCQQLAFDLRYGVDTSRTVMWQNIDDVDEEKRKHGHGYGASSQASFTRMLDCLGIPHAQFTFVDIGSGKGAVLLYASHFPFKRVIGVEFSPGLHAVAQENIRRYRGRNIRCKDVTSVCMDALEFPFPDDPLVVYLFNPFKGTEMPAQLLGRLEASVRRCPRPIFVVSYGLKDEEVLDRADWLERIRTGWSYAIYQNKRPEQH